MASTEFLTKDEEKHIIDAISRAEHQTSGEVRIHIENHCHGEPLERAEAVFHDLGMSATEQQNGVLIYIASDDQQAAVYAGEGIHSQVENSFWDDVLAIILNHFKKGAFEEGMVKAIDKVGTKLKDMYPYQRNDVNELSDEISYNENSEK